MDFDTFESDNENEINFDISNTKVVIRIDKRNARKSITYLEGWEVEFNILKEHLKILKTKLGCNGSVKRKLIDNSSRVVFQLQGDKRNELLSYLVENDVDENNIEIIG